jgi:magnesium and cobalt transporter
MNERRRNPHTRTLIERLIDALRGGPADRESLRATLRAARGRELLDSDALEMLEGVLAVSETQVREVMVPRSQMVVIERDAPRAEVLRTVVESGHSRFPVVGDDKDQVTGVVLAKDLLRHFATDPEGELSVREYLRPAAFIPESKRLNVLLKEFRASRNHMALVVDEYGGVAGLITIEDVLEQIVGDIGDEHDVDEGSAIVQLADNRYTVRALTPLDEFNAAFGAELGRGGPDDSSDTVGGAVTAAIGHIPRRGERIMLGRLQFRVQRADNRRVHLFELTLLPEAR